MAVTPKRHTCTHTDTQAHQVDPCRLQAVENNLRAYLRFTTKEKTTALLDAFISLKGNDRKMRKIELFLQLLISSSCLCALCNTS